MSQLHPPIRVTKAPLGHFFPLRGGNRKAAERHPAAPPPVACSDPEGAPQPFPALPPCSSLPLTSRTSPVFGGVPVTIPFTTWKRTTGVGVSLFM